MLPLKSQYVFPLPLFMVNNKDFSMINSENHNIHTRQSNNLHLPIASLISYQQDHYSGIQDFSKLPLEIKNTAGNLNKFKQALRKFLTFNLNTGRILQYWIYKSDYTYFQGLSVFRNHNYITMF